VRIWNSLESGATVGLAAAYQLLILLLNSALSVEFITPSSFMAATGRSRRPACRSATSG